MNRTVFNIVLIFLLLYCGTLLILYGTILDKNTRDNVLSDFTKCMIYIMMSLNSLGSIIYTIMFCITNSNHFGRRFYIIESIIFAENIGHCIFGGVILGRDYDFLKQSYANDTSISSMFGFSMTIYIARMILTLFCIILFSFCLTLTKKPLIVKAYIKKFLNVREYSKWNVQETPCIICLEEYTSDVLVAKLSCGHYYHKDCLIIWNKNNCPLCNQNINTGTDYHTIP